MFTVLRHTSSVKCRSTFLNWSVPMDDPNVAKTQKLPRLSSDLADQEKEAAFEDGQKRILQMIDDNVPLPEILNSLVLLIEAQAP